MMFLYKKKHTVDVLFAITLFALFAISVVAVTGTGAEVYQNVVDDMSENYDSRTAFSYVTNKLREGDSNGNISIGEFSGLPAIEISEEIDNITYCTYLYFYDGYVKEIFTRQGSSFDPQLGTDIFEADSFSFAFVTDSLLKFSIAAKGSEPVPVYIHIHSIG